MSYQPYTFTDLGGGLRLDLKADALGESEAIDALNVTYTEAGGIESRDGYGEFTAAPLTLDINALTPFYSTTNGYRHLIAGCGTRLEALDTDGTVIAAKTGLSAGNWRFTRFGAPNDERLYAGNGSNLLQHWDGATWTEVAGSPKAGALAVDAETNRLVATRFVAASGEPTGGGAASSPSTVYFSNIGDPDTWDADDYIHLTPGDGERIQAAIAWREFVFIFKETKFFVFYGETTDPATGGPLFLYRTVDTGVGALSLKGVAACEAGVFFLDRTGVYVTTGGEPELVSEPVSPIIRGGAEGYFQGEEMDQTSTNAELCVVGNRLYIRYPTISGFAVLVYDYVYGWWTVFDLNAVAITPYAISGQHELAFALADKTIMRLSTSYTDDDGADIETRWRGGFNDLGSDLQKRVRQQRIWGTGQVAVGVSKDYERGVGTEITVDMTDSTVYGWNTGEWNTGNWSAPAVRVAGLRRSALLATLASVSFRGLTNQWSVHRMAHHVAHMRTPTIKKAGVS